MTRETDSLQGGLEEQDNEEGLNEEMAIRTSHVRGMVEATRVVGKGLRRLEQLRENDDVQEGSSMQARGGMPAGFLMKRPFKRPRWL